MGPALFTCLISYEVKGLCLEASKSINGVIAGSRSLFLSLCRVQA